jgi:hypothetical protein
MAEEGEVRLPGVDRGPKYPRESPKISSDTLGVERIGQRALAVGDLNGDHSADLAALLTDGTLRVYFSDKADMPALMLRLPKGVAGPVTAACWTDEPIPVATGVAAVAGQTPGFYLPIRQRGSVVVRYRFPGKPPVARKVKVEDNTTDVILTPDGQ